MKETGKEGRGEKDVREEGMGRRGAKGWSGEGRRKRKKEEKTKGKRNVKRGRRKGRERKKLDGGREEVGERRGEREGDTLAPQEGVQRPPPAATTVFTTAGPGLNPLICSHRRSHICLRAGR